MSQQLVQLKTVSANVTVGSSVHQCGGVCGSQQSSSDQNQQSALVVQMLM